MSRYLVTGVAGFIANRVAAQLLDGGHEVVGIDCLNDAYDVRLKEWRLQQLLECQGFTFYREDIRDLEIMRKVFATHAQPEPFECVFNLAARAGVPQSVLNPWIYIETNTVGVVNLLELCREFGVNKFQLASTSSVYGKDSAIPFTETAAASRPLAPYPASKKAAEEMCYAYHYLHGIDITVNRYFTVYGPAGRPEMSLFRFTQWISEGRPVVIYGDGTQSRDFTYVDDIARGTILGQKKLGYEIINLGSDHPIVLMDAIHILEGLIGKKADFVFKPFQASDITATWANVSKARELLGWQSQQTIESGLEQLVKWYFDNRSWAKDIVTL